MGDAAEKIPLPPVGVSEEDENQRRQRLARLPLPDAMAPGPTVAATSQPSAPRPVTIQPPSLAPQPPPARPVTPLPPIPTADQMARTPLAAGKLPPAQINPAVPPQAPPGTEPEGTWARRVQDLTAQGPPKLPWWKQLLDTVGSLHPLGRAIEENIPGSPQNYSAKMNQAAVRAAAEQTGTLGKQKIAEGQQGIEKGARDAANEPEDRDLARRNVQSQIDERDNKNAEKLQDVVKSYSDALAAGDTEKAAELAPRVRKFLDTTDKSEPPPPGAEDKDLSAHLAARGRENTPANRDKARKDLKLQDRPPAQGSFTPIYNPKTGVLTGFYDPTTGQHRPAPEGGGTTGAGITNTQKVNEAKTKELEPFQSVLDKEAEAKDFAAEKTGPGDIGLILAMVEATRPKAGFRMTQTEWNMIQHSRSSLGDVQALVSKVETGQMLTPDQRQQMLDTIHVAARFAQKRLDAASGDSGGGKTEAPEGTRVKMKDGSFQVKKGGKWQPE